MTEEHNFLTTEQVAFRLGVKPSRVRQLVGQGRLLPLRTGLRAHLFSVESVEAFEQAEKPVRGRPQNY